MGRIFILLVGLLSFFLIAETAFAQTLGNQSDQLRFLVAPEVPKPGDTVLIEAQGIGNFLGDAVITWEVNGKKVLSGLGERSLTFVLGPLGSNTSVRASISSPTKGTLTKDFSFNPSLVNMLWEADTSVPPWYRGKALYSAGSTLTVFAFPQIMSGGIAVPIKNLSFQWKRNNTPLPQVSGRGRNTLTFAGNQLLTGESVDVYVEMAGAVVGRGSIYIGAQKPRLVLYNRDPLRGTLYDQALSGAVTLAEKEGTVQAQPYFFSNSSLAAGTASYRWTLNNSEITGPDSAQGILTLRQSGSGSGSAILGVEMQNIDSDKLIQSAKTVVSILFGTTQNTAGSSLFGL